MPAGDPGLSLDSDWEAVEAVKDSDVEDAMVSPSATAEPPPPEAQEAEVAIGTDDDNDDLDDRGGDDKNDGAGQRSRGEGAAADSQQLPSPQAAAATSEPAQTQDDQDKPQVEAGSAADAPPLGPTLAGWDAALGGDAWLAGGATPHGERDWQEVEEMQRTAQEFAADVAVMAAAARKEAAAAVSKGEQLVVEGMRRLEQTAPGLKNVAQGLGTKLTSWWSHFDPVPTAASEPAASPSTRQRRLEADPRVLQSVFNLPVEEHLLEAFRCKLLQTYRCAHNGYTPDIQMAFQGTLYISDKHVCFHIEERGRRLPVVVEHAQVTSVLRQAARAKGESDILKLELQNAESISMRDFEGKDLESAHALLEHMCEPAE
eukprot:jgi/Chlat1/5173/Chrsp33S05146